MHNAERPESGTKKTRVAYLLADAGIGFNDSKKGSSIHARSMVKAFEQEGCHVDVFVFRTGGRAIKGFSPQQVHGSRLTRWWTRRMVEGGGWRRLCPWAAKDAGPPNWMIALGWLLWHRDFYRHVRARMDKRRPDLIYARSAWLAFPYARLQRRLGVPLMLEVNAVMSIEKAARGELAFAGLSRAIERRMFHSADKILPVSAAIKTQIAAEFGIDPERIVVTPNAVDLDLFHPAENGAGARPGEFVIGAVNSFRAYHGMGTLVRAAARLKAEIPGLRLLLIGKGPQFDEIRELARELGLEQQAEFPGIVDHHRVPELLRRCHVCVAPYEGENNQYNCPMKLYEYMGLKIPVVASAWGDIPNIINHGQTALLHREGDPEALAGALRQVWNNPEAARQRTEAAYRLVQDHTWRATARNILTWTGNV